MATAKKTTKTTAAKKSAPKKAAPAKKPAAKKPAAKAAPKKAAPAKKPAAKKPAPKAAAKKPVAKAAPKKAVPAKKPAPKPAAKKAAPAKKPAVAAPVRSPKAKSYGKRDLEMFRKLLLQKKAECSDNLNNIQDNALYTAHSNQTSELSGLANHMADAASDINALETSFKEAERMGKILVYVEEALRRIDNGTYGVCKGCGQLIPISRLKAVPTATRCVACKQNTKVQERHDAKE